MLNRLTATISVVSHKGQPLKMEPQPTRFSRFGAGLVQALALGLVAVMGHGAVKILADVISSGAAVSVFAKVASYVAGFAIFVAGGFYVHRLNSRIELRMKIAERLAPYFGHKLEETYKILKA